MMKNVKIKNSKETIPVGKIVCVGRNYAKHAEELNNEVPEFPIIFLKPASAMIQSGDPIIYPDFSLEMHHEVELILLIGQKVKNADEHEAEKVIHGYGVGLDMTLRDVQNELKRKGHPWTLAKCFDSSAVVSDIILKENYKLKKDENILLKVNGELRQNSSLRNMIFSPVEIIKYISSRMTLEKGDLIFTGTPEGVGKVVPGDKIFAKIENVGQINTQVT